MDKPVGVAAHPTPGWTGPTVLQGLLAAGHTVATSGAAERQGIVHRLDAGTTGVMVVAKSERAYSLLKQAFRDRTVDKRYHALVQGHPDPIARHDRRADRPAPVRATAGSRSSPTAGRRCRITTRWRRSGRRACSRCGWRPAGPIRSGCTCRRSGTRAWRPAVRRRSGAGGQARPVRVSGCTRCGSASRTPPTAAGRVRQRVPGRPGARAGRCWPPSPEGTRGRRPAPRVGTRLSAGRAMMRSTPD